MNQSAHSPNQNQLLASLPDAEFDPLAKHLELVTLSLGDMLYEPNQQMRYALFPTTAVVSLHYVTVSGAATEIAGVGHEGVVGIPIFMGGDTTPGSALVHTAGHAYRLDSHQLKHAFGHPGVLRGLLLRYTQAFIVQVSQTAACNRHHSVVQQLSRWLLLTLDRAPGHELVMTQELLAGVLGVRRESVTNAAGELQELGVIRYRRGHISVVDKQGLEVRACECRGVVRKELARLLCDVRYRQDQCPAL